MPEISRFHGIVISMYHDERTHRVAHFHARHGGREASFSIEPFALMAGGLQPRVIRLIKRWALSHQSELLANWHRVMSDRDPLPIEPLA